MLFERYLNVVQIMLEVLFRYQLMHSCLTLWVALPTLGRRSPRSRRTEGKVQPKHKTLYPPPNTIYHARARYIKRYDRVHQRRTCRAKPGKRSN